MLVVLQMCTVGTGRLLTELKPADPHAPRWLHPPLKFLCAYPQCQMDCTGKKYRSGNTNTEPKVYKQIIMLHYYIGTQIQIMLHSGCTPKICPLYARISTIPDGFHLYLSNTETPENQRNTALLIYAIYAIPKIQQQQKLQTQIMLSAP